MAERLHRGLWLAIVCCLIASLAGCTGMATGVNAAGPQPDPAGVGAVEPSPGPLTSPAGDAPAAPVRVRVLQLNLCNSGIAACYSGGRSIEEGAAVIRAEAPDLVTLNEVCDGDIPTLERALARAVPGGKAVSAFQAARDRNTGDGYRCANGQQYGIGIVSRWPSVPGSSAGGGIYPIQDQEDPEERAWLCLDVAATPAVAVCTTHLAYTDREVTVGQCGYLFDTVIAERRARDGAAPLVLAGDLNIGSGDSEALRSCLPAGSALADDGEVQHVVATPEFVVDTARTIDLRVDTEHPGLFVTLSPRTQ
jgi:endonuclease/exonuclease/phosphatase family metal-dependent hydrolase